MADNEMKHWTFAQSFDIFSHSAHVNIGKIDLFIVENQNHLFFYRKKTPINFKKKMWYIYISKSERSVNVHIDHWKNWIYRLDVTELQEFKNKSKHRNYIEIMKELHVWVKQFDLFNFQNHITSKEAILY